MHAPQTLPLLALVLAGLRLGEAVRVRIIGLTAFLHGGTAAITVWQALRGQPMTSPDAPFVALAFTLLLYLAVREWTNANSQAAD